MRKTPVIVGAALLGAFGAPAQERASHAIECSIATLPRSLYFVLPAKQPPKDGGGLVVVLPGGDGSRDFLPWVENGLLAQRPDGWQDDPLPRLREGLRWLLSDEPAPKPEWPDDKPTAKKGKPGKNLLPNGGFEQGLDGWNTVANSGRLTAEVQRDDRKEGKRALHLTKTGGPPLDLVTQEVDLPKGGTLSASLMLKSKATTNAWIKVWRYGEDGEPVDTDVDLVRVPKDGDWQRIEKTWPCGGVRAVVQVILVLDGELWVDDVSLVVTK